MADTRPGRALAPMHADARTPGRVAAGADRTWRRCVAGRSRRQALPGCGVELVDQPVRPCRAAHRPSHRRPGDDPGTRDPGRVLAPAGGRTGRETPGHRAATSRPRAAGQGVLCRQRLGRRGSRAEDGLPLVPQSRRGPAQQVRGAGERLPRRNHRRAVGRGHPAVSPCVRAAARGSAVRALTGCLPVRAR